MKGKVFIKTLFMICTFILSTPSFALYWGIFDDYKENKNEYAVVKFINNTPIKYAITTELFNTNNTQSKNTNNNEALFKKQIGSTLQQEQQLKTLDSMVIEAFNTWPKDTLATIKDKNNNREKEFADITPLLSRAKRINLQRVKKDENPDIIFHFANSYKDVKKYCGDEKAFGCYKGQNNAKQIIVFNIFKAEPNKFAYEKKYVKSILIHELGHYFALSDQYENKFDSDIEHSTSDRFRLYDSIMGSNYEDSLSCDDVDGFINVLDLTLSMTKGWSARASKGWNSFCNGKKGYANTRYVKAKIINQPTRYYLRTRCFNQFDKNGNFIKEICAPSSDFDFYNKDLTYNAHGLVETKKDGGFIYEYKYGQTKEDKTHRIYVNYYSKDNYPAKEYIFRNSFSYDPDDRSWILSSCEMGNDDYDSVLFYNDDNIEYTEVSCDGKTINSYFFDQKDKFFMNDIKFIDKKDNKKAWGIVKGKACSSYIEKNGKIQTANADTISKEFNYDKIKIKKIIDNTCSKSGQEIAKIPTINYFIKVKKYFHIN